jgi:dTDP-4-dehydrorhamnose reductase
MARASWPGSGCSHCLLRLEWTYGRNGRHFISKLIERARTSNVLQVVDDQVGAPTATTEVAKVICRLAAERIEGVFHFASAGFASRYDMAVFVFRHLGLPTELRPCPTGEYPSLAARPRNSRFDCRKIQRLLFEPIRPWQEPLLEFLEQL